MNNSGLKKLQKRLLRSNMLASVSLLFFVLFIIGIFLYQNQFAQARQSIHENLSRYVEQISQEKWVDDSYFAKEELQNGYVIYILDHDVPLLYEGALLQAAQRELLWNKLKNAEITYNQSTTVSINDKQQKISRKFLAYQHTAGDGTIRCYVCMDIAYIYHTLFFYFLILGVGFATGCIVLYGISRSISLRATKPIRDNMEQQISFFHAASHELKSPLAVISANNAACQVDAENEAKYRTVIEEECTRMSALVQDLLLVASSSSQTFSVRQNKQQPDTILIQAYEKMEPLVRESEMPCQIEIDDIEYGEILADADRLIQVLQILVSNAIAYGKSEKGILLKLVKNRRSVDFIVRDYGSGIAKEDQTHIFERFYRASKDRNDKSHFGLGLPIARQLTEAMGGQLFLSPSDAGAMFHIRFQTVS